MRIKKCMCRMGRRNRRLASESTPVEQGKILPLPPGHWTERRCRNCPKSLLKLWQLDNTMMAGVTEKQTASSSFSERMKNTLGNIFPFTMGLGTGIEGESQKEELDDEEQVEFESQVSFNSSTQENEPYINRGTGTMDKFGVVRTISKDTNTSVQSRDFVSMTNSETRTGENRNTG